MKPLIPWTGVIPLTDLYLATPMRAMHSRNCRGRSGIGGRDTQVWGGDVQDASLRTSGSKSSTAISSTLLAWAAPICDWFWLSMNAVFTVGMLSLNLCSKPALGSPLMSDCWRTVQIPITPFSLQ